MISLLLVEDNPKEALVIKNMLKEGLQNQFTLKHSRSLSDALNLIQQNQFQAIILDSHLPDGKSFESIPQFLQFCPDAPVLILSGVEEEDQAIQAVKSGVQDYLIKGQTSSSTLCRAVRYAMERQRATQRITQLAHYDHLTGLANRGLFYERLNCAVARCHRNDTAIALMFLDLDHFKDINDTLGHDCGDSLLKTVAARIKKCIREIDTGVRLGGDEFAVLLEQIVSIEDVASVAQRILHLLAQPVIIKQHQLHVTGSLGITIYPWDSANPQELLSHADAAMYRAKAQGGNTHQFYTAGMKTAGLDGSTLEMELSRALAKEEFLLHYQPQMNLRTKQVIGMEALLRWHHPYQGLIGPNQFIPQAEENGMIIPIGEWVLRTASKQAKYWEKQGFPAPHVAVNLSARQIHQGNLPALMQDILKHSHLDPENLKLELTETFLIHETEGTIQTLRELKAMGIHLYIDDFGAGYASLRYLKSFPIDGIKLDQSLIQNLPHSPNDAAIVMAVISLAKALGLQVIAEGVESQEQVDFLEEYGCDAMQGYWIAPPLPANESTQHMVHMS
ncbi:two-component system response regulator [Candidatus Nitrospira allomarina]|uniref:EAL domain-containing protein n=1 Tax=Candidatus Nitrospira allomarina TaxID=3020900 RepID=A0AA96GAF1_9BACT|nr:EAL domain-containing protein [Candidatus Nitrospira allomarina]WNM57692.1 EAL domain-containing protein [Candidatus Nitrospira allomarina]